MIIQNAKIYVYDESDWVEVTHLKSCDISFAVGPSRPRVYQDGFYTKKMIDEFEIQFEKGYNTLLDSAKLNDQIKVRYDDGATKYTVTAVVSTKETSKNKPTYIVLSPLMDEAIEYDSHGGSGGTDDYNDLTNKPKINDVTLSGNKSLSDLGIAAEDDIIDDYEDLDNIPSINGVDLKGNKTQSDLKLDTLPSGNSLPSGEYNGQIFVLLQDSGDTEKGIYRYNLNLWQKIANVGSGSGGEITPEDLADLLEGSDEVSVDLNETNDKVQISLHAKEVVISAPSTATSGTITEEQLAALKESTLSYILFDNEKYYLNDDGHVTGSLGYSHVGVESGAFMIKNITITESTLSWVLTVKTDSASDPIFVLNGSVEYSDPFIEKEITFTGDNPYSDIEDFFDEKGRLPNVIANIQLTFGGVAVANYSILLPNMTDVRGEGGGFNFNGSSTSINEEDIQATDISVRITSSGVSGTMGLSDIGGSEPTESIKIVSEYPATGEEGKLYIKKAPVKASAELIDRGEVGTTRYYKIVDSYRGAPVNYSYDLDSAMHIVSVPAAGIEIKIPFGVMNPWYFGVSSLHDFMYQVETEAEATLYCVEDGEDPLGQNILLPIGVTLDEVADYSYMKVEDSESANITFDTTENRVILNNRDNYNFNTAEPYHNFIDWCTANRIVEADDEEDANFIIYTKKVHSPEEYEWMPGSLIVRDDKGVTYLEQAIYSNGQYHKFNVRPDDQLNGTSKAPVQNKVLSEAINRIAKIQLSSDMSQEIKGRKVPVFDKTAVIDWCQEILNYKTVSLVYIERDDVTGIETLHKYPSLQAKVVKETPEIWTLIVDMGEFYATYTASEDTDLVVDVIEKCPVPEIPADKSKVYHLVWANNEYVWGSHDPSIDYDGLIFTSKENGSQLWFYSYGDVDDSGIQYSYDGTVWKTLEADQKITLLNGQKVCIRNTNDTLNTSDSDYITFRSSGKLEISGNIMSMLNYKTLYEEPVLNDYCFYKLFGSCEALTIAKELELPAKKLKPYCYWGMFERCPLLTRAPIVNPDTFAAHSCERMFYNCAELSTEEELDHPWYKKFLYAKNKDLSPTDCLKDAFAGTRKGGAVPDTPTNEFNWCSYIYE